LKITTGDVSTTLPIQIGFNKDIKGNKIPVTSDIIFQTTAGNIASLKAQTFPAWLAESSSQQWSVDGVVMDMNTDKKVLEIPSGTVGESRNVDLALVYEPSDESRQALSSFWDISPQAAVGQSLDASVELQTIKSLSPDGSQSSSGPIASLLSNLPQQILFFARLMLTTFVLLIVTAMVFAAMPLSSTENR
jgi:hypothetical protein